VLTVKPVLTTTSEQRPPVSNNRPTKKITYLIGTDTFATTIGFFVSKGGCSSQVRLYFNSQLKTKNLYGFYGSRF
jgi:hypothetical protein